MSKLEDVLKALKKLQQQENRGISALELSNYMNLDRANISRYLNILYKEGRVDKGSKRPVIYSILHVNNKVEEKIANTFDNMIGAEGSLQVSIQQAKAAVLYPPHGLHTLILGETGVGKSMFAEMMYLFGKEVGSFSEKAPFIRFNCADYADNPQLVIAEIFGVKKGAYTGADHDRQGLLKKADGGVIFLDEIHRLSPQGQEMLFTYIDNGCFRALGDTENLVYSNAEIIAATTEEPESFMLRTFTRRIPMIITLPSLKERTMEERYYLLEQFIESESERLNKSIYINKNALISFLLYGCPNNIGQLKSDIQLACAKAFLNYKTKSKDFILIEQEDLLPEVKRGLMRLQECRNSIDKLLENVGDVLKFSNKDKSHVFLKVNDVKNEYFYDVIEKKVNQLKENGLEEKEISDILNIDIDKYFKKYIEDIDLSYRKEQILKIVDIKIVDTVEHILNLASLRLKRKYEEKVYFGLSLHLQGSIERIRQGTKIYNPKLNSIKVKYAEEFYLALEAAKIIEDKFDINLPLDEIGYLTMFIASRPFEDNRVELDRVKVIVIMHGNSTASSMVQVANSLIGENYVMALDMPLDMKAQDMYEVVKNKAIELRNTKGILFLVDMGSLTNFGEMIKDETGIQIKTIDMTSTLLVIEAGRKALNGKDLDEIYRYCMEIKRSGVRDRDKISDVKDSIIITACFTGEGSAVKIKQFIKENLSVDKEIKIIPLNILDKKEFLEKVEMLNEQYNIISIVGTINIAVDGVKFISASDIFAGNGINILEELVHNEDDYERITKSLNTQLEDIDTNTLVRLIRKSMFEIEERLELKIPHEVKVGIVIHMSFLIEKIINGGKGGKFDKLNEYREKHNKEFIMVKQSLRKLEINYNINIGEDQLAYIVRMFVENSVSV